jgi:hypothetical protein
MAGFFTAGGFALVTLVFVLKLNPNQAAEAREQAKSYQELKKRLSDSQMKLLRQQAKKSQGQESAKNLSAIITETMATYSLAYSSLPSPTTKTKSGLSELTQKVILKAAPMRPILQFIATVKEAKKSIEVASVNISPARGGKGGEDAWIATVEFVDYVTQ